MPFLISFPLLFDLSWAPRTGSLGPLSPVYSVRLRATAGCSDAWLRRADDCSQRKQIVLNHICTGACLASRLAQLHVVKICHDYDPGVWVDRFDLSGSYESVHLFQI